MYDIAIFIGRLQPLHHGHMALLRRALESGRRVVVVEGSAWQARSPKNPFTWQEREFMLRRALADVDPNRLQVLPVRDYYNETVWTDAVRRGVKALAGPHARIALVGHFKDATSSYLSAFPGWDLINMERQGDIDATMIRDAYFGARPGQMKQKLAHLTDQIPQSTLDFLETFATQPFYAALQEEWLMLRTYREAWAGSPYPPVFVTVDAVVRCRDHVLLIRRAHAPGKGQRALPGGFIEARETLWQSCLRELLEETHCSLPEATWRAALQQVTVFDHPDRSLRGRTITHAHYFDLGDMAFPGVQADDDALHVEWVSVHALADLEPEFFEDHFHMLDHFLHLTGQAKTAVG